ncbi:hypothetical protein ACRS5S_05045 [Nocardia asiatica]|uniref:hypothetical protein n=1 Tax=Nocardia asiatica TaxID=209252 RepID=UPI0012FA4659|nr:hypothetical protein [Nocardia asiatica]
MPNDPHVPGPGPRPPSPPPVPNQQPPYPDQFGQNWNQPTQYPGAPPPAWSQGQPTTPVEPSKGAGFAVLALVLGAAGLVIPFLPIDLSGVRQYLAYVFALPGLIFGVLGCAGPRRGKALAITGAILSLLALGIWTVSAAAQL